MSRTDKTAPARVKALYYHEWVEEHHDHTNGRCELPPKPTSNNIDWGYGGTCCWTMSRVFWSIPLATGCGCPMCNRDPYYEVPKRKRDRMAGKAYVRGGWRKEY